MRLENSFSFYEKSFSKPLASKFWGNDMTKQAASIKNSGSCLFFVVKNANTGYPWFNKELQWQLPKLFSDRALFVPVYWIIHYQHLEMIAVAAFFHIDSLKHHSNQRDDITNQAEQNKQEEEIS